MDPENTIYLDRPLVVGRLDDDDAPDAFIIKRGIEKLDLKLSLLYPGFYPKAPSESLTEVKKGLPSMLFCYENALLSGAFH